MCKLGKGKKRGVGKLSNIYGGGKILGENNLPEAKMGQKLVGKGRG